MKSRLDILTKVAIMYYKQNLTQTYIAKELKISRPTVASMLQEAKDKGIVKISIIDRNSNIINLQENIKNKYGMKNIFVTNENTINPKKDIGLLCADYIEKKSDKPLKIGIGFGTTVYEFINNANYIDTKFVDIVPIMGGVEMQNEALHSNLLCFKLSEKYSCNRSFFYAPVKAETLEQKDNLMDSKLVKLAIENAKNIDLAIVGVGNPLNNSTYQRIHYILDEDLDILKSNSAVGDIVTSFFDKNGKEILTPSSKKFIGLNIDDIKSIPEVVVLASGYEKLEAVKVLAEHKIADTFIIDYDLAQSLIS